MLVAKKSKKIWVEFVSEIAGCQASVGSYPLETNWRNEFRQSGNSPALLFYRNPKKDLAAALKASDQDYESSLTQSLDSKEELIWRDTWISIFNESVY